MERRSQEMLNHILQQYQYDKITGIFRNKYGKVVGCYTKTYPELSVRGKTFRLHQLAFILVNREFPDKGLELDHIDRNKHNNVWSNLRLVSKGLNMFNQTKNENHGLYLEKSTNKWVAQLRKDGKTYKKRFATLSLAIDYRIELENTHYKGNT